MYPFDISRLFRHGKFFIDYETIEEQDMFGRTSQQNIVFE